MKISNTSQKREHDHRTIKRFVADSDPQVGADEGRMTAVSLTKSSSCMTMHHLMLRRIPLHHSMGMKY